MEEFKTRADAFKELNRKILIRTAPILLVAVFAGITLSHFNMKEQQGDVNVYPFVIPFCLAVVGVGLYRGVTRRKKIFNSYTLTFDNNIITREQYNTPTISILYDEVTEIIKGSNGSFTIKGKSAINVIIIPAQIENYEKLEKLLSEIKPFTLPVNRPLLKKSIAILPLLAIGLMAVVYLSNNKIIVLICGISTLIMLGYSFYSIQTNKNIDFKTKRSSWWVIVVGLSIGGGTYYKLTLNSRVDNAILLEHDNKNDSTHSNNTAIVQTPEEMYDTIKSDDIKINNKYLLYTPREKLSELLKKADSIKHDTAVVDSYCPQFLTVYYKKSTLEICDSGGLVKFELWDNSLKVSIKSKEIRIGDNEAILKQMFPKSYAKKDYMGDEEGDFQYMNSVRIYFSSGQYLIFMLNKQGNITDICIWEDDA